MGGTTFINTQPVLKHAICIFGSGNALDTNNHINYARVEKAYFIALLSGFTYYLYALFGCHQPGMKDTPLTEAATMAEVLLHRAGIEESKDLKSKFVFHDDPSVNSTSATCRVIAAEYLAHGHHVHLVINWPYIPRTYYLMYKQAKRQGLNWSEVKHLVHMVPCGGTYLPYVKDKGLLRATLWWTKNVLLQEIGAWGKALLDPDSEKYNQNRTA